MEIIIVVIYCLVIFIYFYLINRNYKEILKYEYFSNYKYFGLFGWLRAIKTNKELYNNFDPELQKLLKDGKKINNSLLITIIIIFLGIPIIISMIKQ
jgi:hypothetical protein